MGKKESGGNDKRQRNGSLIRECMTQKMKNTVWWCYLILF